ncbi:hypothetical protein [Nitrosomonas sp. Nm166]|uniref:hypothetical protein n=1 Tax=Nitrosomonas sp. Nm166 TaxID=1881054 RepID=UPI0008E15E1A|nr:hypothetical protein [Nitrosomonas sp. Nm166]SFE22268.1 hypothetical protein SAMN05428977_10103 [Nitrosomonas sp. Nm166]
MKPSENKILAINISKKFSIAVAFMVLLIGLSISPPAKSALVGKGIADPNHHFPSWFSDANGLALQMCLDGDGATGPCFYDPVIAGNAVSEASGFGEEAFWWSAEADIDLAGGGGALLVLALEAAYASGDPAPNEQIAFGRVRIRIDVPAGGEGIYKVRHPYLGASCDDEVFNVTTTGPRAINVTRDVGGGAPFDAALTSEVGPFLVWDPAIAPTAPAGYVGDPNIPHQVKNGRCGVNSFRIEGPVGVDLDGNGSNVVETNLFSVQGKIFDPSSAPPGIEPVRTSYLRSTNASGVTTSRINSWVKAPPTSTVTFNGPQASQNGLMTFDGESTFFKRATLNAANSDPMPAQVEIVATNASGDSTTKLVNVIDQVNITTATWSRSAQTLKVVAVSSDKIVAGDIPVLTLKIGSAAHQMTQSGAAGRYELVLANIPVPPAVVTVTSSKGGTNTRGVAD